MWSTQNREVNDKSGSAGGQMEMRSATEMEDFSDSESSEYGLKGLATLPLLEQVHRLFHAIQQKYPYTETEAWKSLPLEQKRRMLEYIRERRAKKHGEATAQEGALDATATTVVEKSETPAATAAVATRNVGAVSSTSVRTDPYLQMLQKRSLRVEPVGSNLTHPNTAYAVGQQQMTAQYVENQTRRSFKSRWKVVDAEFYDDPVCACGVKHDEISSEKSSSASSLLTTMRAMLSTFGDHTRPCLTAVKQVKSAVGDYLRDRLRSLEEDGEVHAPCLRTLVDIFSEEAVYYGRWREFRGETKQQEPDLEDVEEEELAEELDLFAVSETDAVFNDAFLERIRFADERTREMDWSIYDSFARSRKLNFMSQRGAALRLWLRLGSCSRASLEFMNFVAYHNIGRLVEAAIKLRTGGRLQALESPLLKTDIEAATEAFKSEQQYRPRTLEANESEQVDDEEDSLGEPPAKSRRVVSPIATTSESSSGSISSSSAETPVPAPPQRLSRLKRLR